MIKISIKFINNVPNSWNIITDEQSALFNFLHTFVTEEDYQHFIINYLEYRLVNQELVYQQGNRAKTLYEMEHEMTQLKKQLIDMDYKTSKYADGEYTQEEWVNIVAERKAIRSKIRELEVLMAQN